MKSKELREMTIDELELKEKELIEAYFKAKLKASLGQLENTSSLRNFRKDIARVKTFIRQKMGSRGQKTDNKEKDIKDKK
jgi:large subunit ribosomal protein L29